MSGIAPTLHRSGRGHMGPQPGSHGRHHPHGPPIIVDHLPMVKEIMDAFLDELPILPPKGEVHYKIDHVWGEIPIFKAP
jgi:hypothetical protein